MEQRGEYIDQGEAEETASRKGTQGYYRDFLEVSSQELYIELKTDQEHERCS